MIHAFTVDVEDYHNVIARDWLNRDGPPTEAVVRNTSRILQWLAERSIRATFFTLGEVAQAYPALVKRIAADGHELGVHGFYHRQVFKLTPQSFRKEVEQAKCLIEDLIGASVDGHRAPAFSIMPETRWALDVLADVGFRYDSSIFPISGNRYGWPGFPREIHNIELADGRSIIEAPLSTISLFGKRLPACGGGYIRHFPGLLTHWAIRWIERSRPAIVYTHPYEIELPCADLDTSHLDPAAAMRTARFHRLQTRNRDSVERKMLSLLNGYQFAPLREVIDKTLREARRSTNRALVPSVAHDESN